MRTFDTTATDPVHLSNLPDVYGRLRHEGDIRWPTSSLDYDDLAVAASRDIQTRDTLSLLASLEELMPRSMGRSALLCDPAEGETCPASVSRGRRTPLIDESSWLALFDFTNVQPHNEKAVLCSITAIARELPAEDAYGERSRLEQSTYTVPDSLISSVLAAFRHIMPGVPWEVQSAVFQTIGLIAESMHMTVGQPEKEYDPEDERAWWVRIPVLCKGTVNEILAAYNEFNTRFVQEVPNGQRDRIVIDLKGGEE